MTDINKYNTIKRVIDQAEDEVKEIQQVGQDIRILKNDQQKQILSFFFPPTRERLVLKIACPKGNVVRRFFNSLKKSACQKEFENTMHFFRQGFNVPEPLLWKERKKWGKLKKGYYLSQEIDHAISLRNYLRQLSNANNKEKLQEKRHIIKLLGEYIGRLHQCSIYHGDLRCNHILIKQEPAGKCVYLIDCEASQIYPKLNRKTLIYDLRKLRKSTMSYFKQGLITQTDRLRFFKEYGKYNPQVAQNFSYYTNRILELKNEWGD